MDVHGLGRLHAALRLDEARAYALDLDSRSRLMLDVFDEKTLRPNYLGTDVKIAQRFKSDGNFLVAPFASLWWPASPLLLVFLPLCVPVLNELRHLRIDDLIDLLHSLVQDLLGHRADVQVQRRFALLRHQALVRIPLSLGCNAGTCLFVHHGQCLRARKHVAVAQVVDLDIFSKIGIVRVSSATLLFTLALPALTRVCATLATGGRWLLKLSGDLGCGCCRRWRTDKKSDESAHWNLSPFHLMAGWVAVSRVFSMPLLTCRGRVLLWTP